MVPLDRGTFRAWLDDYVRAWETADAAAAARLFAPDATYRETPFSDPFDGREAIRDYWAETTSVQEAVDVEATVEGVRRANGFARFSATYRREGDPVAVEGFIQARFVAGDCVEFREWWHASE
jgi:uncharacterized protein (TIGR02246 family)